jgi:hypothetical protein
MKWLSTLLLIAMAGGCARPGGVATRNASVKSESVSAAVEATAPTINEATRIRTAIDRGVAFLVACQNADGSWGTGLKTTGFEIYSRVPGSHDAFRVGTTALCVTALREAGETEARARGLGYLVRHGQARRDDGDKLYNTWAHAYTIQALAGELKALSAGHGSVVTEQEIRHAIAWHVDMLQRYETHVGGWNYYDFNIGTQRPAMGPTSFGTAAALVALHDARQAGADVPRDLVDRAVRRLGEMRLPNGAYLYDHDRKYAPRAGYNLPRGSVGRSQAANVALWAWGHPKVGEQAAVDGLQLLEAEGSYLNLGRKRPYPHDSWYSNAPYYYYFGYYYAARALERLGERGKPYRATVLAGVLPHQEEDGSWFDYIMWDYHKPYGTAFAVMTLVRCRG